MKRKTLNIAHNLSVLMGFVMLLSLGSCDSNMIYEEHLAVADNIWMSDDIKAFEFEVIDTMSPVNIFVNLRTTTDYKYSNIYVFLYSEYPNGTSNKDTLEFLLAKSDGEWYGENTGTVVEFHGLIASGGRFSTAGKYQFQLQHAMREKELPEVIDVGIRVEIMEEE
ncbi:MAG: gliding motility lipoprotein GldH [Crocinitomix sp.]|nr:gliding motility lipoprotein GldH [Crocinitomix sp.]